MCDMLKILLKLEFVDSSHSRPHCGLFPVSGNTDVYIAAFGIHQKRFTSWSWAPRNHPGANVRTFAPVCSSGRAENSWGEWGDESQAIMYREPHCCGCKPAGSLDQKIRRWKGRLAVLINATGWAALLQPHRCECSPNGGQGVKSDPGNTSHQPVWREEKPPSKDLLGKDNRSGGWTELHVAVCAQCVAVSNCFLPWSGSKACDWYSASWTLSRGDVEGKGHSGGKRFGETGWYK